MRQIRDTSILQIDITNACVHNCSNCSRFCGHYKKTYFMDFETFKRAVDSVAGYEGLVSIMGGEPLLHPQYQRFAEYLHTACGGQIRMDDGRCLAMVKDYPAFIKSQRWFYHAVNKGKGSCLFSSVSGMFYSYFEGIGDTMTELRLNDHEGVSLHQPILVSRKELGVSDEEFHNLRSNCWLQDTWSASITPKGAFFCEIAGALDMLFHGPGGKKIEPGWWDLDMDRFQDQFHWCDICGMALDTYSRRANEGIDDVSPALLEKLEQMESPKLKKKQVAVFDMKNTPGQGGISPGIESVMGQYVSEQERFGAMADNLKPKGIFLCLAVESDKDMQKLEERVKQYGDQVSGFCVITLPACRDLCRRILEEKDIMYKIVLTDMVPAAPGARLNLALTELGRQEWLLFGESGLKLPEQFAQKVCDYYLNPGYLFMIKHQGTRAVLLSGIAAAVKRAGFDRIQECGTIDDIISIWGSKAYTLEDGWLQLPDTNIPYLRDIVCKEYEKDIQFQQAVEQTMKEHGVEKGSDVLLLHAAYVYHTIGIWRVLEMLGYRTWVLSSSIFKEYFEGLAEPERMLYFADEGFFYENQEDMRSRVRKKAAFAGTVVPFSYGASTVKYIDGYTHVLRTAENITGRILGILNIRRKFAEAEYDIWNYGKQE